MNKLIDEEHLAELEKERIRLQEEEQDIEQLQNISEEEWFRTIEKEFEDN